jgi:hypothetical protein
MTGSRVEPPVRDGVHVDRAATALQSGAKQLMALALAFLFVATGLRVLADAHDIVLASLCGAAAAMFTTAWAASLSTRG